MDGLLVSYANVAADVAGHVAFGVDPPALLADFFSAVVFRVRFDSLPLPSRAARARRKTGALSGRRRFSHSLPTLLRTAWSDRCRSKRYLKGRVVEKQRLLHPYITRPVPRGDSL